MESHGFPPIPLIRLPVRPARTKLLRIRQELAGEEVR